MTKARTLEVIAVTRIGEGVDRVIMNDTNGYMHLNLVAWTITNIKHVGQYQVGDKVEFTLRNLTHPDVI